MAMEDTRQMMAGATDNHSPRRKMSSILVVTRNSQLAEPVMEYVVDVAARLQCRLLVAFVNTLPHFWDGGRRHKLFASSLMENAAVLREKATVKGVEFDYVHESGKISKVIHRLCHIVKRIEFVVIDRGIKAEEAVARTPVPAFNVIYGTPAQATDTPQQPQDVFLKRITRT